MISHPILPSYNLKAEFLVDIPEENPADVEAHHGYRSVH